MRVAGSWPAAPPALPVVGGVEAVEGLSDTHDVVEYRDADDGPGHLRPGGHGHGDGVPTEQIAFEYGSLAVAMNGFDQNGFNSNGVDSNGSGHGSFEISDYSFDIEQTLNIGPTTNGPGAGHVKLNPFSIARRPGATSGGSAACPWCARNANP